MTAALKFPQSFTVPIQTIVAIQEHIPSKTDGGFQRLFNALRHQMTQDPPCVTVIDYKQAERIVRYFEKYGGGGWQSKVEPLARQLRELGVEPDAQGPSFL